VTRGIRVVRIIARLNTGGPAIHTVLLTAGLQGNGWRSRLVTGAVDPGEGDMAYFAEAHGVHPEIVPGLGRRVDFAGDFRALARLVRILWRERPDIVHTHTTKAGALGRVAAVAYNAVAPLAGRRRAKLVHTFHGHVFHGYFSPLISGILVRGERLLARLTDRVLTVSESVKSDLVERYRVCPAARVTVVPLGFDFGWLKRLDAETGAVRRRFGVPASAVVVGAVGRLTEIKNHGLLFSALSRMKRDNIRALILGDGELRADLESNARALGLDGDVVFTGWHTDPAAMFADLDVVCLTSRNEGTPVALIEAMAAGRPFVATNVGGVVDLMAGEPRRHPEGFEVYDNGILTPPDDADALAAALRFLIDGPELRGAMGTAGQAFVLRRFGKERLLEDIGALYTALVADRKE
jgi:glycosyltransferase involved in cell wall biosynthesis